MPTGPCLHVAIDQIKFAREYTNQLLSDVYEDEWFEIPLGSVTHLGWQMGHLAMAQYGLTMLRLRGKEPSDARFISNDFMRTFKKGSIPIADAGAYPTIADIRVTLDIVHARSLEELDGWDEADLLDEIPEPYAVTNTKLGSLFFCSHHEMVHAGQIGLLRRMLGKDPIR